MHAVLFRYTVDLLASDNRAVHRLGGSLSCVVFLMAVGCALSAAAGGTSDRPPAISGEIYRLDLNGHRTDLSRSPAQDTDPMVSPDGQRVAFVSSRTGRTAVYVVGIDGRGLQRISGPLALPRILSWSPDGAHILVETSGASPVLFALTPGTAPLLVAAQASCGPVPPSWSPDSRVIAFIPCQADTTVRLIAPFHQGATNLTVGLSNGTRSHPRSSGRRPASLQYRARDQSVLSPKPDGSSHDSEATSSPGRPTEGSSRS